MNLPQPPCEAYRLAEGIDALPQSLLWLERSRSIVAADVHLAYEEVIGGALPLWSTPQSAASILDAVRKADAREIILLGDIIHGSVMSEGAAEVVTRTLDELRGECTVTLVAGNHEGRSRGEAVLGDTVDAVERDGWLLVHGDAPSGVERAIIGHLHPTLPLASGNTIPAFLASHQLIVVPATTPYSSGLNVLSRSCTEALHRFVPSIAGFSVVASARDRVFPFGSLGALRSAMTADAPPLHEHRFRRRYR